LNGKPNTTSAPNEGEGNKTAARAFYMAQRSFVQSGEVEEKAREAERALDGPEGQALEKAAAISKSHRTGVDPEVVADPTSRDDERIRSRAYEIWEREGRPDGKHHDHWLQAEREAGD